MAIASAAQLTQISSLYVALFNRAPDTAGLSFWGNSLASGASLETITQGFLNATEGQLNYPSFQTSSEFVNAFYTKVFGRAPDAGGLAFWSSVLDNAGGAGSNTAKANVISQIITVASTPLATRPAGLTDAQYAQTVNDRALFANKVEVGNYLATRSALTEADSATVLTGITADPATVANAKSALFNTQITNALTGGGAAVTGSASNDVFAITAAQLIGAPAGFSLDGGAGVDTLTIASTGSPTITDTLKNVSNVEVINISGAGATTTTVAAPKFAGATTFGSVGPGSVTITGLASGQTVAVAATGTTSATYDAAVTAAALNVSGGTSGPVTLSGTGLTSANVASSGAAPNTITGTLSLAATISTVSINATTGLTATLGGGKAATAVTITGAGAVNLNTLPSTIGTVDASGNSGGLTATIGASIASLTGSSATDRVSVGGALGAGTTINLGGGDDALLSGAGSVTAGATLDGGAGTDAVSSALVTGANGAAFKNFEILQVESGTITDASVLSGSTLTGLILAGGSGGAAVNNITASQTLTVTGAATGATTLAVKDALAGTNDAYTVTLGNTLTPGAAATAGTISIANVETLNINSGGTVTTPGTPNTIDISDAALKTVVITGGKDVSVTFSTATTATSLIDGSAATGVLTINTANLVGAAPGSGGLTVKGGGAADQLTVTQVATVTGGAGADTFFTGNNGITVAGAGATAAELTGKLVTVSDFTKGDTVDLRLGGTTTGTVSLGTVTDLTAQVDLLAAANTAANTTASAAAAGVEISAFRFGGDTYLLLDAVGAGAGGAAAGDVLVKLTGVVDLTSATVDVGLGAVVYA
jgi:S-layer protein